MNINANSVSELGGTRSRSALHVLGLIAMGATALGTALACGGGAKQDPESGTDMANVDDGTPADDGLAADDPAADDAVAGDDSVADDPVVDDATADDPGQAPTSCDTPAPGAAPLRRLTNAEYVNTAVDLVGDAELVANVTKDFPREPTSLGFRTSAHSLTVTPLVAEHYVRAAEELGKAAVSVPGVVPCEIANADAACTQGFVETFGQRVYRRPLTQADLVRYSELYNAIVTQTASKQTAFETMAAAMFSSSNFLFRVELSQPSGGVSLPQAYEMASRLSYLLWQTMPDAELFRAAAAGELESTEGVQAQVKRMTADPKALRVYEFFEQWLDIDEAAGLTRIDTTYPDFDPELVELFKAENRAFVYDLLVNQGTFKDLLAADYTFANRALAQHYGLSETPAGATFERVAAPERAGVLTQATLVMHDRPVRTSIVKRGLKIRTDFLCQIVPAPPDDVDTTLPELDGSLTQRERLAQHREEDGCSGCHSLMDPIGEIFESYDALGRLRTTDEAGAAIVTGGSITATATLNGEYADARQLALAMAESDEVKKCFTLQAFRFFYGRDATSADRCTQDQLAASFARNDFRIVDLLIGLTRSDQFLYRAATMNPEANGEQP